MKKIILLILFCVVFAGTCFAFDLEQISKSAPAKLDYPGASALIIKDYINYEYKSDNTVVQTEDEVIKILDSFAVERFGSIEYVYNPELIEMIVEEAKILTAGGELIDKAEVTEETPFNKTSIFSPIKLKIIKFPSISEGAIIEYKVKTISKKNEFKNNFWGISYFQDYEPILESVLTVKIPRGKPFFYKNFGPYKADLMIKIAGGQTVYTWKAINNPVVVKEFASAPIYNEASQVRFSTIKSWDDFAKDYWRLVTSSKSMSFNINNITENLIAGLKTDEEKTKTIYEYIVKNYECIDISFGNLGFTPHGSDEVIKYKTGTSADLTALFINMLRICGIKAYPAFICTRGSGSIKKEIVYPAQFDRCISAIPSGNTFKLVDVSSKYNSIDNIPADIQGQTALVIEKNNARFYPVPIAKPDLNKEEIMVEAVINEKGDLKESIRIKEFGSNSVLMRRFFSNFDDLYRRIILVLMARSIAQGALPLDTYFSSFDKIDEPYSVSFVFQAKAFLDTESNLMYFTLPMFPMQNIINMVAKDDKERIGHVVIGSTILSNKKIKILLPENFELKGLPRPINMQNSVGSYKYFCGFGKNKIEAASTLIINKIEVPKSEYKQLKDLIEAAVDTERQLIVLKKK